MKKKTAVVAISILSVLTVLFGTVAVTQKEGLDRASRVNEIYGEHALSEASAALAAMDDAMRKSQYATSPGLLSRLCAEAAVKAGAALTAFEQLPYSTQELERTAAFLNAAGDYALYVSRRASRGEIPDGDTNKNMAMFSEGAAQLSAKFMAIRQALEDNAVCLDGYGDCADDGKADTVGYELQRIEESLKKLPDLVYDGQFSAVSSDGGQKDEITQEEARRIAAQFMDVPEQLVSMSGEASGQTPCRYFSITAQDGEEQRIAVTNTGDVVEWDKYCSPSEGDVTEEEAADTAADFLAKHGFGSMEKQSSEMRDGFCVVKFASNENSVVCLAGGVSVSVARDTGEVCSLLAWDYCKSQSGKSVDLTAAVSSDDAIKTIPGALTPQTPRLVVVETDSGSKLLCYEIPCTTQDGQNVTVYVDAATGQQEKIEFTPGAAT